MNNNPIDKILSDKDKKITLQNKTNIKNIKQADALFKRENKTKRHDFKLDEKTAIRLRSLSKKNHKNISDYLNYVFDIALAFESDNAEK